MQSIDDFIENGNHRKIKNDNEWQQISLWLRIKGIPLLQYNTLSSDQKRSLHEFIFSPNPSVSERQQNDLFARLAGCSVEGRTANNVDFLEERNELFRKPSEQEKADYLSDC